MRAFVGKERREQKIEKHVYFFAVLPAKKKGQNFIGGRKKKFSLVIARALGQFSPREIFDTRTPRIRRALSSETHAKEEQKRDTKR
jgi:hypothetical protein